MKSCRVCAELRVAIAYCDPGATHDEPTPTHQLHLAKTIATFSLAKSMQWEVGTLPGRQHKSNCQETKKHVWRKHGESNIPNNLARFCGGALTADIAMTSYL
jgi:hypothetical protein